MAKMTPKEEDDLAAVTHDPGPEWAPPKDDK